MNTLFSYLRHYWPLVALSLSLATVNQVFSLLDPLIFRCVIDKYALQFQRYNSGENGADDRSLSLCAGK